MKSLSIDKIDVIEAFEEPRASWLFIEHLYGKNQLTERLSYYQVDDRFYCIIDRTGNRSKTLGYQYETKEEANKHFLQMKLKATLFGCYVVADKRSGA